jgi:hypothetical protein
MSRLSNANESSDRSASFEIPPLSKTIMFNQLVEVGVVGWCEQSQLLGRFVRQ